MKMSSVLQKVVTESQGLPQIKHIFILVFIRFKNHVTNIAVEQLRGFDWGLSVNLCGSFSRKLQS